MPHSRVSRSLRPVNLSIIVRMTDIDRFITTWKQSGGAELANSQSFLNELCDVLGVPHPDEL